MHHEAHNFYFNQANSSQLLNLRVPSGAVFSGKMHRAQVAPTCALHQTFVRKFNSLQRE